ncbi:MAG: CoA transferase [Acidobacteriota bacterium]|jgi:crotonobetainyl-CoA:carnitine CoA-transferase CaiB-like acyl-CoA transferase
MMVREENISILEGIVVLDLADEKGSFCSRLLADLGASVIKVETPQGDSSRHIGPFYTPYPDGKSYSLSFIYNNLNKRSVTLDIQTDEGKRAFKKLVKKADILVETPVPEGRERYNLNPADLSGLNPRLIHLSITAFGRNGPKHSYQISDCIASASGGQMYVCRDISGKPVKLYGAQSYYTASLYGAVAVLFNLMKSKATGKGSYIDLSIQEAVASTLDHVMVDYFSTSTISKQQNPYSHDRNFTLLPCRDGHILISIHQNWETLTEILAAENIEHDLSGKKWLQQGFREDHFGHVVEVLKGWTAKHTKQELFELGQAMRFPWAPVAAPGEVLKSPQLQFRRFFIDIALSGKDPGITLPGSPYIFSSYPPPSPKQSPSAGKHTSQVIEASTPEEKNHKRNGQNSTGKDHGPKKSLFKAIRVLDLTRMLSGPYCTRILADSGAEVIKVQTKKTALGAEQNGTAYFNTWNRNKRSVSLDLSIPEARDCFLKLAAISDIIVENYSPRVMENWGLTYAHLKRVNPSIIMLSISAMGQTGPWRNYVGFGPTFHALSGLTAASSVESDSPVVIGHAYGDIVIGLYAAFAILAALEFRNKTGQGQHIDLSGYEALCTFLGPALMCGNNDGDSSLTGKDSEENIAACPDQCFPCRGIDRWCALTIKNDEEWRVFRNILDIDDLKSSRFSTLAGRKETRAELERLIARWTAGHSSEFIAGILQKAGIAASVVQNAEDVSKDPQLVARDFFISLKHPVLGSTSSDRSALWPGQSKHEHWRAAPQLGEDNEGIFVRLLGMSDETFRYYIKRGVIG